MRPTCWTSSASAIEARVVSAHRTPERLYQYAQDGEDPRAQGDHRGRRRRRPSAGHDGVDDGAAGAGRAGREPGAEGSRQPACRSRRCRAACRWRPLPSAKPARRTRGCSPRRCWRSKTALWHASRRLARAPDTVGRAHARWRAEEETRQAVSGSQALSAPLAPGATIGILGGGQLGRMLALAAARLGFKSHVFPTKPNRCAF